MQRQGVFAARGVGRCMLVLALTGVVDSTSRTGGSFIHPSKVRCFRVIHLHAPSSPSFSVWLIPAVSSAHQLLVLWLLT
jgi:hypothetical protein